MKVTWSETADEAVTRIERRLAEYSTSAATNWVRLIRDGVREASRFPRSRRMIPELADDHFREVLAGDYRVWYRIFDAEDRIEVLVVFHGAMSVPE